MVNLTFQYCILQNYTMDTVNICIAKEIKVILYMI